MSRMLSARRLVCLCLLAAAAVALTGGSSSASLVGSYQSGQQRASQLRAKLRAENQQIEGFQGSISSLQSRLTVVQGSVTTQEQLLGTVSDELSQARMRLVTLR